MARWESTGALALGLMVVMVVLVGCSAIVSPDDGLLGGGGTLDVGPDAGAPGADATIPPGDSSVPPGDGSIGSDTSTSTTCAFDTRCVGERLETCVDGVVSGETCLLGCGSTAPGPHCLEMLPSNVEAALWRADTADLVIEAARTFDTGICATTMASTTIVAQEGSVELCVLSVGDFEIRERGTLSVQGSRPLVIMAAGTVRITGVLDLSADGETAGPGGFRGGSVATMARLRDGGGPLGGSAGAHEGTFDDGGGAGGGLCGRGGTGGTGGTAPGGLNGGPVDTTWELVPLLGGSGGGRGRGHIDAFDRTTNAGFGGAGGGALQISTRETIRLSGVIAVGGGGGLPGRNLFDATINWGSGGGGGAGGAVLLEAPTIRIDGGRVLAGGGGGGGGAGTVDGEPGQDGGVEVAAGGWGDLVRGAPGGGGGGAATLGGHDGGDNFAAGSNGGGGGGGAGCLLFRSADGTIDGTLMANPSVGPGLRMMPARR